MPRKDQPPPTICGGGGSYFQRLSLLGESSRSATSHIISGEPAAQPCSGVYAGVVGLAPSQAFFEPPPPGWVWGPGGLCIGRTENFRCQTPELLQKFSAVTRKARMNDCRPQPQLFFIIETWSKMMGNEGVGWTFCPPWPGYPPPSRGVPLPTCVGVTPPPGSSNA